jgi:hypothetical protein
MAKKIQGMDPSSPEEGYRIDTVHQYGSNQGRERPNENTIEEEDETNDHLGRKGVHYRAQYNL